MNLILVFHAVFCSVDFVNSVSRWIDLASNQVK